MNILFLFASLSNLSDESTLYSSLINEFKKEGHNVYVSSKGNNISRTFLSEENGIPVIRINSHEFTAVNNNIRKALAYIEYSIKQVHFTKHFYKGIRIDLIVSHSLPPEIGYISSRLKHHFKCPFYLIHSDFTWQDAVVYGYFKKNSIAGIYYRTHEKVMFKTADYINVPLEGTIKFIRSEYPWIPEEKFSVCQFWQKPLDITPISNIREEFNLKNKFVVIYGGSVGKAQRLDYMVYLAESVSNYEDIIFLLLGKGAKLNDIKQMVSEKKLKNFRFLDFMPKQKYIDFLAACDVGLIILNEVHASPNFPSKTSSYFNLRVPILASIDEITSFGHFLDETGTGLWSVSGDVRSFKENLLTLYNDVNLREKIRNNEFNYFIQRMTPEYMCKVICDKINREEIK